MFVAEGFQQAGESEADTWKEIKQRGKELNK